ncbi:hypothetical protein [Burkholderia gladioli]|uniref:hypothetical protein n=1 Tax=Burkholderia gladioli TaxID=28095 RepID=UPI0015E7CE1B|nr:hypothetical protein [Burkholderia gladioli]MBA1366232.1 hypothetical protein [Burkholderia gladioli]
MNCKPGDLAILIHASLEENIGKIVKVLSSSQGNGNGMPWWHISCESMEFGSDLTGQVRLPVSRLVQLQCPDAWLRPISGVPVTDDVTDEVVA